MLLEVLAVKRMENLSEVLFNYSNAAKIFHYSILQLRGVSAAGNLHCLTLINNFIFALTRAECKLNC